MGTKAKNPLYVVKGDQVEAAENFLDLMIKKFNLQPVIDFILFVFKFMMENIKSYAALEVAVTLFDDLLKRLELFKRFAII
jgi:ATP adenylyltransferase/5',5'''-P-1,P-4-tetraphosphate phosphorylase II